MPAVPSAMEGAAPTTVSTPLVCVSTPEGDNPVRILHSKHSYKNSAIRAFLPQHFSLLYTRRTLRANIPSLPLIPTPLSTGGPPAGYGWEERAIPHLTATTAFNTGIDQRDRFLGRRWCVICGTPVLRPPTCWMCNLFMNSK